MGIVKAYRIFDQVINTIADRWFDDPIQDIAFDKIGDYSPSLDGACEVKIAYDRIAFLKPRETVADLQIANEKIASDIGYLIGLPVAPAVIRPPDKTSGSRHTLLSLSCLKSSRHWSDVPPALTPDNVPALEALRVFWTWIGDLDHDGHPNNLLYEVRAGGSFQLVSIDHSFIWGAYGDAIGDPLTSPVSRGYATQSHRSAAAARRATMDIIQELDFRKVQQVVDRLVDAVLTRNEAGRIAAWLVSRKAVLGRLLDLEGNGHD